MGDLILGSLVEGLMIGFVYGIAAMGLSLIFGVMNVINLAHGPIITLGMFGVYLAFSGLGWHPYLAILAVAASGLLLGVLIYGVAIHRIINAPHLSSLLATFAVNMMIIGVATTVWTTTPRNVDFAMGSATVGPLTLQWSRVAAGLAAVGVTLLLYLFLYRTRPGKYVRAVANNRIAAELMGIPSHRVLALSFGLGTMLATIAGGLIATLFPFTVLSGGRYELLSFVIVVLGGLGNPLGALIGGLILGVLEGITPIFMPYAWVPVLEFVLFVAILVIRPSGLLGAKS
jgi:branched-subunit amino acid ABC-type transport system permease component